jgi:hypothetical protein
MPRGNNAGRPFIASACDTSFDNDCRMVVLDVYSDCGARLRLKVPEGLMATVTGHFLRDRLFGLH